MKYLPCYSITLAVQGMMGISLESFFADERFESMTKGGHIITGPHAARFHVCIGRTGDDTPEARASAVAQAARYAADEWRRLVDSDAFDTSLAKVARDAFAERLKETSCRRAFRMGEVTP